MALFRYAFHPVIQRWFAERFGAPTEPQRRGWPLIAAAKLDGQPGAPVHRPDQEQPSRRTNPPGQNQPARGRRLRMTLADRKY